MAPVPTATEVESPGPPKPLADIDGSLLTYTMPDDYLRTNQVYDFDGSGSQLVYVELYGEHGGIGQVVWLLDLATGQLKPLNDAEASVGTLFPRISGDDVVWSAGGPTANNGTLPWRVMHYQISSGETEIVEQGVNSRNEDGSPSGPTVALDAGLVAYTVESPTDSSPYGWKIVLRRFSDNAVVREIQTRYAVWDLAVHDGNVLYAEVPPPESGDSVGGLMLSTMDHPEPVQIADNGSGLAIDGQRIVWAGVDNFVVSAPVTGQGVFTATFDDLTPVRLSQPTQGDAGGRYPAAGDGVVVWSEPAPAWDNFYMWDSGTGRTYQIAGQDSTLSHRYSTYLPSIADGWLTWSVALVTGTQQLAQFAGLSIGVLRSAEPS